MSTTAAEEALEKLAALAEQHPQVWEMEGPIMEEIVLAAEERLGLPFPLSYRMFLLRHGFASFCGGCVGGIHQSSTVDKLVGALFFDSEKAWEKGWIPRDCLFVENQNGSDVLIDTSQMKNGEAPIIEVPVGTLPDEVDRTPISPSFAEYYLGRLEEMIEYLKEKGALST